MGLFDEVGDVFEDVGEGLGIFTGKNIPTNFGTPPWGSGYPGGPFDFLPAQALGGEFSEFLRKRLGTPVQDTEQFRRGKSSLRDALEQVAQTSRQRLGESAVAGGFMDSGIVPAGVADIDRAEMQAFGQGLNNLILGLEERRTEGVMPFLDAAMRQAMGTRGQNLDTWLNLQSLKQKGEIAKTQSSQSAVDIWLDAWLG